MIRPAHFGYNEETAANNAFQTLDDTLSTQEIQHKAAQEFDLFVEKLRAFGIDVLVVQDSDAPMKPDAIFPNNWLAMQHGGNVFTFPMFSPKRRNERRQEVIAQVAEKYKVQKIYHYEGFESYNTYLEGTGSMIFDHANRIAYACISPRTDRALFRTFCADINYRPVDFTAVDGSGQQIYHTNVMMTMGETFVVICMNSVTNAEEHTMLRNIFADTNKEIIDISLAQMNAFAGNMLQLKNTAGEHVLIMSEQAYTSLEPHQIAQLEQHNPILHSPLYTIEKYGGGSARCMIAEIFLEGRRQK